MVKCPTCGAVLRSGAKFCNVCGDAVPASALTPSPLSNVGGPAPTQMMAVGSTNATSLQILLNDGQTMPLHPVTTIGRDVNRCNCLLPNDERISRVHATLEEQSGQWILSDRNSANGTFVNGVLITTPVAVNQGEKIQVGDTVFSLGIPGLMAPQPAPWGAQPMMPTPYDPNAPGGPGVPDPLGLSVDPPPGGWRNWDKPPLAEGVVRLEPRRYTVKKGDLLTKGCVAVTLALIFAPLAFLPFIGGNEVNVVDVRLQDANSNNMVSIRVRGDLIGDIGLGDAIAVWGKNQKGIITMRRGFNYTTGHEIRVK